MIYALYSAAAALLRPIVWANLESLELGMAEIELLVISSLLMCGAEGLGSSPYFEGGAAFPY
jgi:hypothetical protein